MKTTKFGYFFTPTDEQKRYITVAIERPGKDDPDQIHKAAFAFCSTDRETFRKSQGRKIAEGRLRNFDRINNINVVSFVHNGTINDAINKALEVAVATKKVPTWVERKLQTNKLVQGLRVPTDCSDKAFETYLA